MSERQAERLHPPHIGGGLGGGGCLLIRSLRQRMNSQNLKWPSIFLNIPGTFFLA